MRSVRCVDNTKQRSQTYLGLSFKKKKMRKKSFYDTGQGNPVQGLTPDISYASVCHLFLVWRCRRSRHTLYISGQLFTGQTSLPKSIVCASVPLLPFLALIRTSAFFPVS